MATTRALLSRAAVRPSALRSLHTTPAARIDATAQAPYVKGTVNDPTTYPPPNKAHGSLHWTFERLLSGALIPVTAATLVTSSSPVVDGLLAVSLVLHTHIGFDAILSDYLHPRKFPVLGTVMIWVARVAAVGTLYGYYVFSTQDIGITELCRRAWKAQSPPQIEGVDQASSRKY